MTASNVRPKSYTEFKLTEDITHHNYQKHPAQDLAEEYVGMLSCCGDTFKTLYFNTFLERELLQLDHDITQRWYSVTDFKNISAEHLAGMAEHIKDYTEECRRDEQYLAWFNKYPEINLEMCCAVIALVFYVVRDKNERQHCIGVTVPDELRQSLVAELTKPLSNAYSLAHSLFDSLGAEMIKQSHYYDDKNEDYNPSYRHIMIGDKSWVFNSYTETWCLETEFKSFNEAQRFEYEEEAA